MKQFLKMTFATITGVIFCSVITFVFIGISVAGMLASDSTTSVKDNSVFVIKMNGSVEERAAGSTPIGDIMGESETIGLDDLIASIRKAKDEDFYEPLMMARQAMASDKVQIQARMLNDIRLK